MSARTNAVAGHDGVAWVDTGAGLFRIDLATLDSTRIADELTGGTSGRRGPRLVFSNGNLISNHFDVVVLPVEPAVGTAVSLPSQSVGEDSMAVDGDLVYVLVGDGIRTFDISDLSMPTSNHAALPSPRAGSASGTVLLTPTQVIAVDTHDGVLVFDRTTPASPTWVASLGENEGAPTFVNDAAIIDGQVHTLKSTRPRSLTRLDLTSSPGSVIQAESLALDRPVRLLRQVPGGAAALSHGLVERIEAGPLRSTTMVNNGGLPRWTRRSGGLLWAVMGSVDVVSFHPGQVGTPSLQLNRSAPLNDRERIGFVAPPAVHEGFLYGADNFDDVHYWNLTAPPIAGPYGDVPPAPVPSNLRRRRVLCPRGRRVACRQRSRVHKRHAVGALQLHSTRRR